MDQALQAAEAARTTQDKRATPAAQIVQGAQATQAIQVVEVEQQHGLSDAEILVIIGFYRGNIDGMEALPHRELVALLEYYRVCDAPLSNRSDADWIQGKQDVSKRKRDDEIDGCGSKRR